MSGFDALLSADSQNKPGDSKLIDCINTKSGESFEILPQYRYHLIEDSNYRSRCTYKFEIALIAQKDNFVNNIQKDSCDDTVLVEEGNINTDEIYINSIKLSEDDLCKLGGFYKSQISPKKINLVSPDDLKWAEYTLSCRDWIILEDNLLSIDIDLIRCVNTLAFRIGVRVDSRLNYLDLKISSISCANEVELLKKINNLIIKCRNCGLELESISNFYPFSLPSELYRNSIGSIYCEECQDNLVKDKSDCDDLQVSRKHNILYISDEAITVNSPSKELVKNKILHYNRKNKEESLGINGVEGGHISCSKCKIAIGSNNSSSVSYIKSRVAAIAEGYDLFWRNSESVEIIEKIQFEDSLKLTLRFNSESISIIKVTREPDTFLFVQNNPVLTSRILYKIETTGAENSDNRNKSVDKDAEKNANSHSNGNTQLKGEERREFKMKPVILEICQGFESSNRIYESYKRGHQDEYEDVMNGKVEGSVLGSDHASKYEREYGSTDEIFRKIKNVLTNPGGLVAIPTETVYGLAGNIYIEESLRRIFEIKNRPFNDPLIVHVDSFTSALEDLYDVNVFEAFLMLYLANRFTPGPLTIVARCNRGVSGLLTNNTGYLATRCPDNEICRALLRYLNIPLAAPSANKFGHISPTCAEHVYEEFAHEKLHILDGGQCKIGIESTVIKITTIDEPEIICIDNRYTFSGIKEQVVKRVYRECRKAVVDMYGELNKIIVKHRGRMTSKDLFGTKEKTEALSAQGLHRQGVRKNGLGKEYAYTPEKGYGREDRFRREFRYRKERTHEKEKRHIKELMYANELMHGRHDRHIKERMHENERRHRQEFGCSPENRYSMEERYIRERMYDQERLSLQELICGTESRYRQKLTYNREYDPNRYCGVSQEGGSSSFYKRSAMAGNSGWPIASVTVGFTQGGGSTCVYYGGYTVESMFNLSINGSTEASRRDSTAGSGYTTDSGSKKEHTYMHKRALSPDDFRADEAEEQLASPRRAVVSCVNGRIDLFDLLKKYQNVKFKVEILRKGAVTYEHLRYTLSGFENVKVTEYERRPEKKSESEKAREEKVVSEVMAEDRILPEDLLEDTIVSDHILEDVIVPEGMVEDVIVPEPVLEDRIVSDHILEDVIVPEVMLEDVIAPERMLEHRIAPEGVLDEKVLFEDALADKLVPKALLEDNVDIFENIEKYKLLEKELEDLSNGTLTVSGLRNIISTLKRLRAQKAMSSMSTAADEFLSARDYNEEDYLTVNDIDDIISVDQFDCNDDDYMSVDEADNSMVCFIDDLSDGFQKDNKGAVVPDGIADTIANGYVDCISEGTVNSCANSMYGSPNPVASAISDGSVNSIYGTPNGIPDSFANAIVNRAVNMASGGALGGDNGTAVGKSAGTVANGATNAKDAYQGTEGDRTGDPGATSAENSARTNASRINNSYVRRLLDRALDNNDTGKDKDIIIDEISGKNSFCFDDLGKGGVDGHDNEDGGKQQPVSDEDDLRFEAPGMALTHYAPNVPTYLVVVTKDNTTLSGRSGDEDGDDRARTEGPVGGAASGANNGSTLKKVDCSNIVMIDIGYRFKRHSGAFREYLPVNNEPTSVAKQLYSVLRRAESAAQHGAGGPSDVQAVIAIHFNERKTQLYSAIHDRITRSTSGNPIYAQIGDQELEFLVN
nr:hypothetical protein MACL_00003120 [Theileria orientalis]